MGTDPVRSDMIRVYDGVPVAYSEGQFRADLLADGGQRPPPQPWPIVFLESFDIHYPTVAPEPPVAANQIAVLSDLPTLVDGAWTYQWLVRERTQTEMEAARAEVHVARADFAAAVMVAGIISPADAEAWGPGNALPPAVAAALEAAISDPTQLSIAKIKALSSANIRRTHPLITVLKGAFALTDDQVDAIFATAQQISEQ